MNLALSSADARQAAEVGARAQRAAGLGPQHRVVHCLNYQLWMRGLTDHTTLETTGATVIPFGVGDSELLIRTVLDLGINAISCTPSYPRVLERVLEDRFPNMKPRDLGLQLGLFGGEAGLDDDGFRSRLETTWGFKARNANYGVSDAFCNFAGQCDNSNDLHFVGLDVLYPELVDPNNGDSLPWQAGVEGELVLTHLAKECQPLVRFRTSDIIFKTDTESCACGRTAPRFRVVGRSDDMVIESIQDITREMVYGEKMIVGAIHGWAAGGGLEWLINCDLPILAAGTRCFFPEIALGVFVTGAVTTLRPKLVGLQKARELILFGERFDAQQALDMGLAWKVVPEAELFDEAAAVAGRIAALPQHAVGDLKRVIDRACNLDAESAMELETAATVRGFRDPSTAARVAEFNR